MFVRYLVPVLAEVDLASGRATQVHVEDEAVGDAEDVLVIDEPDLSAADRERAMQWRPTVMAGVGVRGVEVEPGVLVPVFGGVPSLG